MPQISAIHRKSLDRPGLSGRVGAVVGHIRRAVRNTGGGAAVEFALVSGLLVTAIVLVAMLGLVLYLGQALDRATAVAARQIMTGVVQTQGQSQATFVSNVVCPALPAAFTCSDVIVNVQTVQEGSQPNGYYAFLNAAATGLAVPTLSNTVSQFSPGLQGSYIYMQVIYPITFLPPFMASLFATAATYNGSPAYLAISTAVFRNEQY